MNATNRVFTGLFDIILTPLEVLGMEVALILVSGIFGILALIAFKHISSQKGIKGVKDKIKAHVIEIRIYQDDLVEVSKAVGKVLLRNVQYLTFNFGPIIPLLVPFSFVAAQLVTRYAFEPVPVTTATELRAGEGTTIRIEFAKGQESAAAGLQLVLPEGVEAVSPLVRVPSRGKAFQEVVVRQAGAHELKFVLADGSEITKQLVAGAEARPRMMQPERVQSSVAAVLWPAEDKLDGSGAIAHIQFEYPFSELGWLPGSGVIGVLLVFLVASMIFGVAVLKPLGITI